MPEQPKQQKKANRWINEVLYGIINAIVGAPTMISFAAIVYQVHPPHAMPHDAAGCSVSAPICDIPEWPTKLYCQDYHMQNSAYHHICLQAGLPLGNQPSCPQGCLGRSQARSSAQSMGNGMHLSLLRMLCIAE